MDSSVGQVISTAARLRGEKYTRSLEVSATIWSPWHALSLSQDELLSLTAPNSPLTPNQHRAAIVKLGEMRLLRILGRKAHEFGEESQSGAKRKGADEDARDSKRSRPR